MVLISSEAPKTMSAQTASQSEVSFRIAVPDEHLSVLQQKLALTTLPDELEDVGWDCGVPLADIRRLVSRWKEGYDWRKHEAQLNAELPQFTRDIEMEHSTFIIYTRRAKLWTRYRYFLFMDVSRT